MDFHGNLKLSDFGVSSYFDGDKKKSAISLVALARSKSRGAVSQTEGTYCFYSPEMCTVKTGGGYSAYMADMWAASICLWVFIFGMVPFYHPEVMTLFQMIRWGVGGLCVIYMLCMPCMYYFFLPLPGCISPYSTTCMRFVVMHCGFSIVVIGNKTPSFLIACPRSCTIYCTCCCKKM